LKLSVNRLSGDLSQSSFKKYATLDILSGNLFGCDNVPSNDKNSEWTICGSEEFDQSLIGLGGVCGLIVLCVMSYGLLLLFSSTKNQEEPKDLSSVNWFERSLLQIHTMMRHTRYYSSRPHLSSLDPFPSVRSFGFLLSNLSRSLCLLTVLSLILSVPIYVLKVLDVQSQDGGNQSGEDQTQYATHSHLYRWLWTMAFLSGTVPSALLLVVTLMCLMCLCLLLNILGVESRDDFKNQSKGNSDSSGDGNDPPSVIPQPDLLISVVWLVLLVNIVVVGAVNGLYLWSTLLDLSTNFRLLIQFAFGFFIFTWRSLILRRGLPDRLKESRYGIWLFACLNVVNTVIIPCLATALSDPSCYQVMIQPSTPFLHSSHPLAFIRDY
jgi:hypothetical protein